MSTNLACPQGHYCPLNSTLPLPCPRGTFNTNTESQSSAACSACPATYYCDEMGLSNYNTNKRCAAGYICTGGSDSAYPVETTSGGSGNYKCPKGEFCLIGATSGTNCGAGTFQNSFGQSSCKSCPPGYYCQTTGLSAPTGPCDAGYMCYGGATTSNPTDGVLGAVCPIKSYCPAGSAKSIICEDGTKTTTTGNNVCTNCAAGKWCTGSVEYNCPTRRYCLEGSVRGELCEPGTFNTADIGNDEASDCHSCPARYYCIDGTEGSDFCESGHICLGGATTPLPTGVFETDDNYQCPIGRYCLKAGSTNPNAPTDCSTSKYTYNIASDAIDDCLPCEAGYYCPTDSYEPFVCPVGHYCIKGVTEPTDCPINTFRTATNGINERDCAQCTGGHFCDVAALSSLTGKECSTGKFCPIGTSAEINCPPGTYRDTVQAVEKDDCAQCTQGYYCPEGSSSRTRCVDGQHCPAGTTTPALCEAGTYCYVINVSPWMNFDP